MLTRSFVKVAIGVGDWRPGFGAGPHQQARPQAGTTLWLAHADENSMVSTSDAKTDSRVSVVYADVSVISFGIIDRVSSGTRWSPMV